MMATISHFIEHSKTHSYSLKKGFKPNVVYNDTVYTVIKKQQATYDNL